MTCKDCIKYDACLTYNGGMTRTISMKNKAEKMCGIFKNKADFVEVVRCDNCYLQGSCIVEDTFNTARMADSMKFCAVGKRK